MQGLPKKALLSVSDKAGIAEFARDLRDLGFEILSTGGTLKILNENGIEAREVGDYTGAGELFGGRVKTLHPRIHGGILFRRDNAADCRAAEAANIAPIALVCVNLYPFEKTTQTTSDLATIIENIDIGGPALLRAAAKNYHDVIVATNPADYGRILEALRGGKCDLAMRQSLMIAAFSHTAAYDAYIANYMNERFLGGFGERHFIVGKKVAATKYGENPHQKAALYEFDAHWSGDFAALKGEGSFNNFLDLNAAARIANAFPKNAVCIVKHGNPCGFAALDSARSSFQAALQCDKVSAYGGVVAVNGELDESLAKEMSATFFEAIIAPSVSPEALEVFGAKKRVKVFRLKNHGESVGGGESRRCASGGAESAGIVAKNGAGGAENGGADSPKNFAQNPLKNLDFRCIEGGFLLQERDFVGEEEIKTARQMSVKAATAAELDDLTIAYKIAAFTKSNCIVYVKNRALVGIGMGLTSRVDAAKLAIAKAEEMGLSLRGAVCASEAFFPFRDSLDLAAEIGISAVIAPSGSIRDSEGVAAADEHNIALYFTDKRHFLH